MTRKDWTFTASSSMQLLITMVTMSWFASPSFIFRSSRWIPTGRRRTMTTAVHPWTTRATTTTTTTSRLYSGSPRRRRQRRNEEDTSLQWEKFDFGASPKTDPRFDSTSFAIGNAEKGETTTPLEELRVEETRADERAAKELNERRRAWERLSPAVVSRATDVLRPYVTPRRVERMTSVLSRRTRHCRFLFENPSNPSNVWACLRTMDSFGIQHVDVVVNSALYEGKAALSQKRGMRTAMGSALWLTIRNHASTTQAIRVLREEENCRILATDVDEGAVDIRNMDWTLDEAVGEEEEDRPIVIAMGNELSGISEELRQAADKTFYLPMMGFAESFNLSVATAITLAHLSAASCGSNDRRGPLRHGDLSEHEFNCLFLKGLINSIPQKRTVMALLRRGGVELPEEIKLL